ncbi:MAG: PhoU domain-containing protein, partial [Armatimonadota bacterium]|nr:PhoU domain-containing protein [Armatimonadota bacterium]
MSGGGRHIREAYDEALRRLEEDVVRMGSLAGDLIHRAVEALKKQDVQAAEAVIAEDDVVDRLHLDLEERVAKLLATQQPMAGDLRVLMSVLA